ncbi:CTP synthase [Rickettsia prowazekii]|uniref:CTP synthase n=2 Tax=Rickettsia prowazekii TaxID=782 RepID=PYRG_RICPR|nr:CTP synthase [Rickettsia prowazekii]Q9ZDF1.1 RecName: Full=CTP synthase; AltName: Full=Cytidine 5'-triphosphate synthase; AltName: Full=Cytidine triphosphate synthetase; Short=CTP synthetase; Short=CTPS; AltName: Full=UTP--ammonia ligase [Rickettsia prowazekii str. Madrid E]EOB09744.1 CTP synthase [Rickettsia prowazekii str. GvF12]ADE29902.1 CTP synthase [Rickettsia prowazekii str. Rp22]AFE49193.1 CTP synthetase [Rickettsia prowazekii str. Chernikova]AFE50039.1 CTP synthetase [Rickettsia pr
MVRFIFVTGGVVSSLGKGITAASLAMLLQAKGFRVSVRKLDPYLNVDPGTMNPHEHGEVYVTDDGAETDLDLGHYERFTGVTACKCDNITTGAIYSKLLKDERLGNYTGITVQVIPHVTNIIKDFIMSNTNGFDFIICEIGGTVGDIEGLPFFEAIRQIGNKLKNANCLFIHLTLLPYVKTARELKTKPTQHSVKELRAIGISPNILVCRAERNISKSAIDKIALFCNIKPEYVIPAIDQKNIYLVPIAYHNSGLENKVLNFFNINVVPSKLDKWYDIIDKIKDSNSKVKIAIITKYHKTQDAYKSVIEALNHAGIYYKYKIDVLWINAENLTEENINKKLLDINGILVPGGFGVRATQGKMIAIKYARTNNIPFFGICFGMQLATIEIAQNLIGIQDAVTEEFKIKGTKIIEKINKNCEDATIKIKNAHISKCTYSEAFECDASTVYTNIHEDSNNLSTDKLQIETNFRNMSDIEKTMRLGAYPCNLVANTIAANAYKSLEINERHRHRYKFNNEFQNIFEQHGVVFSGFSQNKQIVEIIELPELRWFVGVQFHPEFKSKPFEAHPLFIQFIKATIEYNKSNEQQ